MAPTSAVASRTCARAKRIAATLSVPSCTRPPAIAPAPLQPATTASGTAAASRSAGPPGSNSSLAPKASTR